LHKNPATRFLVQLETPEALANLSPGFERSENPGIHPIKNESTLKGFAAGRTLSGFEGIV
jgi:hypothetical protein